MTANAVQRPLLTLDQVAERLQLSRRTVERHVAAGEIPALQLGGPRSAIRVDEAELEAWLYQDFSTAGSFPRLREGAADGLDRGATVPAGPSTRDEAA